MNDSFTLITPELFFKELGATFTMVGIALFLGSLLGIVLGSVLAVTREGGILQNRVVSVVLGAAVSVVRALPFIILLFAIIPFTRLIAGTSIGIGAALVPLTVMISPYIARLIENSLLEVPKGIIEAAKAMGASPWQILTRFMIPEARGSLILALTIASIGLIDATAMAGTVGAGGIGDLAIQYGYNRYDSFAMFICCAVLIAIVLGVQAIGNRLARRYRRR